MSYETHRSVCIIKVIHIHLQSMFYVPKGIEKHWLSESTINQASFFFFLLQWQKWARSWPDCWILCNKQEWNDDEAHEVVPF